MSSDAPKTLEEMVARYGRALAVIDDETGELKVMGMGNGAHSVDIAGKPKKGTKKPINDGFDPDADEDNQDEDEEQYSEKELKVVRYLNDMEDDQFHLLFPEQKDEESAEELKWLFDTGFAFARRALTGRRKKKKKRSYKEVVDDTEIKGGGPCWDGYEQRGMKTGKNGKMVPNCVPVDSKSECCPEEIETKAAKKKLKDPKGGLTAAGRAHFKRTEGANLKPGVKGAANTPEKMRRKGSFLTRFFTNPSGPMKDEKGRPTRLALSAAAWGEPVPQNADDAAALAAKGRRMLERYENSKKGKKDAWDDVDEKALGPTIGGGSGSSDATRDHDGDGVINDGTPDEKPAPKKNPNKFLEKRTRKHVRRKLREQGIEPTRRGSSIHEHNDGSLHIYDDPRPKKERDARRAARETFDRNEDRKRFVRNQLRKAGMTPTAKGSERSNEERAARRAARAEYERRVAAGEPKKPKASSTPPRKYPDGYVPGRPADRYPEPKKDTSWEDNEDRRNRAKRKESSNERAERQRQERMRPADRSSQRAEDSRNRAKRPRKPVDRLGGSGPNKKRGDDSGRFMV